MRTHIQDNVVELAAKKKAQAVRGKLNVPRKRFRQTEDGEFL
jgi:hypothetical protein